MIDLCSVLGRRYPAEEVVMERGALRSFALAIGEAAPEYTDVEAARRVGHPDLPVPPTYLFGAGLRRGDEDFTWITDLDVDMSTVLHGEQSFVYDSLAHAGDVLTMERSIVGAYEKKQGALTFLVRETAVRHADGRPVATLSETVIVRGAARS